MKGHKTFFLSLINMLDVFVNPNDMTNHSHNPSIILEDIFHSSPSRIWIWWYPLLKSIFEKTVTQYNWSSMSSNHGIEKLYLIVILLMTQPAITYANYLFCVSKAGTTHELKFSWFNLFFNNSSIMTPLKSPSLLGSSCNEKNLKY
jgi:hypothetical protein